MENLIYEWAAFASALLVIALAFSYREKSLRQKIGLIDDRCMALEKEIHVREAAFLEEKNSTKVLHYAELKSARDTGYKEGFEIGKIEREKDYHLNQWLRFCSWRPRH